MNISAETIVSLYRTRKMARQPMMDKRLEVLAQYNGETQVVLPELDQSNKPGVANLLALGLDQFGQRIASVQPNPAFPSLRPGVSQWDEKARESRSAVTGWWRMNKMPLIDYKRARYLLAYAGAPVTIHPVSTNPSDKRRIPFWRVRSPLNSFPAVPDNDLDMEPTDYIVAHQYPLSWLMANFPEQTSILYKGTEKDKQRDLAFEVLEYNDADETVFVAVGAKRDEVSTNWQTQQNDLGTASCVILKRTPNRAGVCLMVWPGRITLDKAVGQFDGMLHLFTGMAKMAAYEEISMFRSIFQEEWLVSHPNAPTKPRIVREADPRQGVMGVVENGTIQVVGVNPGAQVPTAIDRMERASRLAGNIPAEFGGESPTNVRTARRGASVLSGGVDMPLQEYQEILATSKECEIYRAVQTQKGWFGSAKSMFFMSRDGKVSDHVGAKTYVPNDTFVVDYADVTFSFPGSDSSSIPIEIGQRVGTGEMSLQTAREMDPAIDDPQEENLRVTSEGLEKALLGGMENQAAQGALDPIVIARVAADMRATNDPLAVVYARVHSDMQKEQAAQAPQGAPGAPGVGPGAPAGPPPESMPGAAVPPGGAAGQPSIPPPPQGQANLAQMISQLHPANALPAGAPS